MNEREALIALAHAIEPADPVIGALVDRCGPIEVAERLHAGALDLREATALQQRLIDPAVAVARAARLGARIIERGASEWPTQLDDLGAERPYALWVVGAADLRLAMLRSISVVGARASTPYGERVASDWCASLVEESITVVSGGAYGIDAAAHRSALDCGGLTVCVLASGVDVAYPRGHEALIARIADDGLVLSESPLGEGVRRHRFLTRNRVIAALTRATVVIESALRSGTTSTARAAGRLNRPVFAVPGPVTSPMSAGCHRLVSDGEAILADDVGQVVEVIAGLGSRVGPRPAERPLDALTPLQSRVHDALRRRPMHVDEITVRAGVSVADVLGALGALQARGLVLRDDIGWQLPGRA